jgi:hypothetical protein
MHGGRVFVNLIAISNGYSYRLTNGFGKMIKDGRRLTHSQLTFHDICREDE